MAIGFGTAFLVVSGHFAGFTFIRPFLEEVTRLDISTVSLALLVFGLGGFLGNFAGGVIAERNPAWAVALFSLLIASAAFALSLFGTVAGVAFVATALWGVAFGGFSVAISIWNPKRERRIRPAFLRRPVAIRFDHLRTLNSIHPPSRSVALLHASLGSSLRNTGFSNPYLDRGRSDPR
ncbi:MFS transporter [Rhizobium leguminosarum]|uniref:MFS transporter n=1 Tax=Rhizobium leguminosarum TaxID=384 RepID=UPI0003646CF0|nr:MFS transporter [Rhizobium leguminosarum]